jgi:DNA-binding response OmpR family regulator
MKKILVVSPEPELYFRLDNWYSKVEYQIIYTPDTSDNLKSTIDQFSPDLIVVDCEIPAVSGLRLSLKIRQWSSVPLLLLSTVNTRNNEIRLLDLNSKGYLSDPYDISTVAIRINIILSMNLSPTSK